MIAGIWILWAVWVLFQYFVWPSEPIVWFDGELFPAPYWREAAARAGLAVAGAALTGLAAWGCGRLVVRRATPMFDSAIERWLFELAIGFATLSFAFLALAYGGMYRPRVVQAIVAGVACLFVALLARHRTCVPRRWPRPVPRLRPSDGLVTAVTIAAMAFALVGALAPEVEHDALWYHLWIPARWLAAGSPIDLVHEYPSLYPMTWELLFGAAMSIGGPVAAKLLHFACLGLVGLTTAMVASRLPSGDAGISTPAMAAALAVVAPTMIWEGTTAYIDLALAWYVVLVAHALARYWVSADTRWLVLSAILMGVALSLKHLALVAFAVAGTALLIAELRRRGVPAAIRACAIFGAIAVIPPAPWYARAYAASGNPVFPDLYSVFGAAPPERWNDATETGLRRFKERFGRERTAAHFARLPWDVTLHADRYRGSAGPLFLVLLPLALFAGPAARWVLLACGMYVLVWASPASSFQFRFLVPVLPLAAVAGAAGAARLPRAVALLLLPVFVLNLPPFINWHERNREGWTGWLTHVQRGLPLPVVIGAESERRYLARTLPSYRAWQFANAALPADARVLTFSGGDHLYSERARLWSDAAAARPATWDAPAGREPAARRALARLRITHVLMDIRQASRGDARGLAIASDAMRQCCLDRVYEDDRFVLYRVK